MSEIVTKALDAYASNHQFALQELDVQLFAASATATKTERTDAVRKLTDVFCSEDSRKRFIAGVVLSDLLAFSWARQRIDSAILDVSHQPLSLLQEILGKLSEQSLDEYKLRNMQARIIALCLEHIVLTKMEDLDGLEEVFTSYFEPLASKI
jgi:hypothetical protein